MLQKNQVGCVPGTIVAIFYINITQKKVYKEEENIKCDLYWI